MRVIRDIQAFIGDSRAVGIVLLCCTGISLLLANCPWSGNWLALWQWGPGEPGAHHWTVGAQHAAGALGWPGGAVHLPNSVIDWLNDAGMALFFCLAGMEIKRELMTGELSTIRQAVLPAAGAIGGMVLPALLFALITRGTTYAHGWGIPMATDIAFSLGVAAILGTRMPIGLKVFLTALAIIDDLGAIITIAVFYSAGLNLLFLLGGLGIWLLLMGLTWLKMPFGWVQVLLGLVLWYCFFNSGIHATVAGVLFAFAVPQRILQRWEHQLHFPVNFIIIPLFALANTAIVLPAHFLSGFRSPLSLGILSGLLIGKTLGITGAVFLLVRTGLSVLPTGSHWRHVIGTGLLAGIGFTMSIFITLLAYTQPDVQDSAKIAVLAASLLAMGGAIAWFRWVAGRPITSQP
jgi:NhaA family Na+:H+ antiporter